ncbi:gamma-glutamyltransferase [Acidocella sp.]|uniref:gamma-glutamyltransferase n=1 Tax=Acidocella sp. TaxID=50710 RepID=UPI002604B2F5|nr:gamma-glutamyltransferase [Acidocella sp.]
MVATPHYLGSGAALNVLRDGGNAIDAAITAAATLGTVLPHMTGIGGDAFWLIYDAKSNSLHGIDGSGPAGRNVSPGRFDRSQGIPERGAASSLTVPGAVDSWRLAHSRFGSLPLKRLLEPAIDYAREGTPVTAGIAGWIRASKPALLDDPGSSAIFLKNGGEPKQGDRLFQHALAKTLTDIGTHGCRFFYDKTALDITNYLQSRGGMLSVEDFSKYQAEWVDPISVKYRNYEAFQLPPPSQGIAGLMMLNYLQHTNISEHEYDSPEYYNLLLNAIRWALERRDRWLTDPKFLDIPIKQLLDSHEAEIAVRGGMATPEAPPMENRLGKDTAFIATADADGNAVGLVQSLYYDFGAAVLDPETGVLLQNRGAGFSLDPSHPNVLAPGKKSATTLMAGMLFRDGKPYMVHGTQGGDVQAQTNASLVTRVVDFNLNVQQAIEAPRILFGRSWGDAADQLLIETRAGDSASDMVSPEGRKATGVAWPHPRMGTAQAIRLSNSGNSFLEGGADPRGEGIALGF